jgi:spermidine synthase
LQAVIRLSKLYLKDMSASYNHPKVKVHIGDGFKFLDDYKNTFDVIITDSSDPEGPAESLFQKPYFKLLHDALREGGVITTQGCTSHYSGKSESWEEKMALDQAFNGLNLFLYRLSGVYQAVAGLDFRFAAFFSVLAPSPLLLN